MGKERPTFSEHWYRVAKLRLHLMPSIVIKKQFFRGQDWMLIQSSLNDEYFRLHAAAYGFIALLDGQRTVAEAWEISNKNYGDAAPTQGEAIQLMGRLFQANLLQANLPPDSAELFKRFKQRRGREMRHTASSILFPKFPLFDPNILLGRWLPLFSWMFGPLGVIFFTVTIIGGLTAVVSRYDELWDSSAGILSTGNLPLLYLAFVFSKIIHELGSAFASKRLGRREGDAGQIRQAGIMLLLLAPAPYIDTSGVWGLRKKSHRIIATSAGILSEFTLAALAAIVWANTTSGSPLHAIAYNLMFVASVSTFFFNGNPLLRFDAYYILCDICETPNLAVRSQHYLYYLVKRYIWKMENASSPAHSRAERILFFNYGIAAGVYRVFLVALILLTVAEMAFFIGVILALVFAVLWFIVPLAKLIRYLKVSGELFKARNRAVITTTMALACLVIIICIIPFPDRFRLQGVVEAPDLVGIYAKTSGTIMFIEPNLSQLDANNQTVFQLENPLIRKEMAKLMAREKEYRASLKKAQVNEPAEAQSWQERLAALEVEKNRISQQISAFRAKSPIEGTWVWSEPADNVLGRYVQHGQLMGQVIPEGDLIIRANITQVQASLLLDGLKQKIEIRVKGRPDLEIEGEIISIHPAGTKELPTAAMGIPAGGETQIDTGDQQGLTSQEYFFEVEVKISPTNNWELRHGNIMVLRFSTRPKSLWFQGKRALLQMFQKRFHI